jgi:hypothetical protein
MVKFKCDTCIFHSENEDTKRFIKNYCKYFECKMSPQRKCEYYKGRDIQRYYDRMAEMSKFDN